MIANYSCHTNAFAIWDEPSGNFFFPLNKGRLGTYLRRLTVRSMYEYNCMVRCVLNGIH